MATRLYPDLSAPDDYPDEPGRSLEDYLTLLKRRWVSIALTAGILLFIALVVAVALPPEYRSAATILIQEQEIPQDLVRSTVTSYADERIQVISQQVLSRAVLLQLVEKYDLYPHKRRFLTNEEILDRMRADIKLTPVSADVTDRRSGAPTKTTIAFKLSYASDSPDKAQKIANELVSRYLNENIKNRELRAAETSSFLNEELSRLSAHINEVEAKLSTFKALNQGALPELATFNRQVNERVDNELIRVGNEIASLSDRRISLQAELAQTRPGMPILGGGNNEKPVLDPEDRLKSLKAQLAGSLGSYKEDHPDILRMRREIAALERGTGGGTSSGASDREDRLAALQARLVELKQKYADDHPDVLRVERSIVALQALPASAPPTEAKPATRIRADNPVYLNTRAQIDSINAQLGALGQERKELRAKQAMIDKRLQQTPEVEREYLELARDQDSSRLRFRELKAKQMEADVSEQLERNRKGERFTLIDPPQFPERPASPNRWAIVLIGSALAVLGGVSAGAIRETVDQTIKGAADVVKVLHVGVLSVIPVPFDRDADRRDIGRRRMIVAGVAVVVALGLALVHFFVMPLEIVWFAAVRRLPF